MLDTVLNIAGLAGDIVCFVLLIVIVALRRSGK